MRSTWWVWSRSFGVFLLLLTVVGCGSSGGKAKVKGRVKFFDKNLNAGTVAFMSKDGQLGSANIDSEGNYEMSDAPIGDVKISVTVPTLPMGPATAPKAPSGIPPMRGPNGEGGMASTPPSIDPRKIVQIPGKYAIADSSGLTYTVQKGEQVHNITLSP